MAKTRAAVGAVLGKGASGTAYVAAAADGTELVRKVIRCRGPADVRAAKSEARFLEQLESSNVIGYRSARQCGPRQVDIFMEFADGGDLDHEISRRKQAQRHYTQDELMERFADIASGVESCHSKGVVHRDIKPGNIFLSNGAAKVGDFGIARSCSKNGRVQSPVGTPLYLDPQRAGGREYGQKADMWSLGCVLYEMAALRPAFPARNWSELIKKISSCKVDMSKIPEAYDPEVKEIIADLLQVQEGRRICSTDLLRHRAVSKAVHSRKLAAAAAAAPAPAPVPAAATATATAAAAAAAAVAAPPMELPRSTTGPEVLPKMPTTRHLRLQPTTGYDARAAAQSLNLLRNPPAAGGDGADTPASLKRTAVPRIQRGRGSPLTPRRPALQVETTIEHEDSGMAGLPVKHPRPVQSSARSPTLNRGVTRDRSGSLNAMATPPLAKKTKTLSPLGSSSPRQARQRLSTPVPATPSRGLDAAMRGRIASRGTDRIRRMLDQY